MIARYLLLCCVVFTAACVKDRPEVKEEPAPQPPAATPAAVYVTCEGNFGSSNAVITQYDPSTGNVTDDIFRAANERGAGDVIQSMTKINGEYFIVVNNSGKIIVCDEQMKEKRTLSGFRSPRFIESVGAGKAYVTDIYDNSITVIDPQSGTVISRIPCRGWSERISVHLGKAYIGNYTTGYVYVINTTADKIEDSIYVAAGAGNVVCDAHDHLWVLASGDAVKKTGGMLLRYDIKNSKGTVIAAFSYTSSPSALTMNSRRDTLYYLNNGVWRLPAVLKQPEEIVSAGSRTFYGLGVSPASRVYVSDVLDYNQRSVVYVYSSSGNELTTFKTGVNANGFYFR